MATIEIQVPVRLKPTNKPADKVVIRVGSGQFTLPALDVVEAVLAYSRNGHTRAPAPAAERLAELKHERPAIGEKGLYGIYAGIARADADLGDHIVEVLEGEQEKINWADAIKWAESLGGTLPTRKEQALLFANVPELFKEAWYWSCETNASDASYAWYQSFTNGHQSHYPKDDQLRARAVRRLAL